MSVISLDLWVTSYDTLKVNAEDEISQGLRLNQEMVVFDILEHSYFFHFHLRMLVLRMIAKVCCQYLDCLS